ncbi:MAG: DUF2470 domain-containing protein [Planctomycetes bacterium]|nr:DUF2470 domain-containing protein [Planctomycetota bacterium]
MAGIEEPRIIEDAYRFLRSHTAGELRFDENFRPVRYAIDPAGRPVAPVMYAMLEAVDAVLFIPQNAQGAMELQVTLSELDPDGPDAAATDRWRIYHGEPRDIHWAILEIDAARYEESIIDGVALVRPNPLAQDEPRLCQTINERHRADLRTLCRHFANADVEHPTLVGVDPLGFDVRRRFEVIRLHGAEAMQTADDVRSVFERMVREASAAAPPEPGTSTT